MKKNQIILQTLIAIGIIVLLNILGTRFFYRVDLTKEKRFSLSKPSKKLADNLQDYLFVKVYLEGEFPAPIKKFRNAVREYLDEFRAYSHGFIQYDFIDPSGDKNLQEKLADLGMQSTFVDQGENQVQQKIFYPGAVFTYRGKDETLLLLKNTGNSLEEILTGAEQSLEYDFATAIKKLTSENKKKIGLLTGHGELNQQQMNDFMSGLREMYDVFEISVDSGKSVPPTVDALLIARPTQKFSEREKYEIDQYLMQGGRAAWFIDKVQAEISNEGSLAVPYELNLDDMFLNYGFRVNDNLVEDIYDPGKINIIIGMLGNQPMQQPFAYKFYPKAIQFPDNPVTKNLSAVLMRFASSVDTIKSGSEIEYMPLLLSSPYSRTANTPVFLTLDDLQKQEKPEEFKSSRKLLGLGVEGKFYSVFRSRKIPTDSTALNLPQSPFLEKSKYTKMAVIGDASIINSETYRQGQTQPLPYDNKNFAMNVMDWLADDSGLIEVRTKEIQIRKLDEIKVREHKTLWQIVNMLVPTLAVVIFGIIRAQIRKRKNSKIINADS